MTQKILGNVTEGKAFVISAPAGTGKTTLVRMLIEEFPCIEESISCTTRSPRLGEIEGKDYFFISEEEFQMRVERGDFLEYAQVFGHWYGTSKKEVSRRRSEGKHVVLVIDTQGALSLQQSQFAAVYIFIAPPSMQSLEDRLVKRQTESTPMREQRLSWASKEMSVARHYDFLLINEDIRIAYTILKSIFIAEEHKIYKSQ